MASGDELIVTVPRLDGGYNSKDSPANIEVNESPDCLNVTFDDRGAAQTRFGSKYVNTSVVETGSNVIDGGASYNSSHIVWAGGCMFRMSGTTAVTIGSAQGAFASGAKVAHCVYQSMLISSDGTNGPYRYHGPSDFYRLGITIPSAPTAASNVGTVAGGGPETGTYYYKIAYMNTAVVEGEAGSPSAAITASTTAVVNVTSIPTGSASFGVAYRRIYRASTLSGTYRRVGTISDNVASIFTDTMGATTWSVQTAEVADATAPTPFTTIKPHKEVLWFDDSSDRTLLRYTDYGVPYISQAENYIPTNQGDGSNIIAIGVQDDLVSAMKDESIWVVDMIDPADATSYSWVKSPSNLGIVGPRAFVEIPNGLLFVGKLNGKITGFHILSGIRVSQTADDKLRTDSVSERLERDILALPSATWDDICLGTFSNAVYAAVTKTGDTGNAHMYWLDIARIGNEGQPGSWAPWDGLPAKVTCLYTHNGTFYGGSSIANGKIVQVVDTTTYADDGAAIDSYWWSKKLGGEERLESWFKDWRKLNIFYALQGNYNMRVRWRVDGDTGVGYSSDIPLNPGGITWGSFTWGTGTWGAAGDDAEALIPVGGILGRRIQIGVTNLATVAQSFKVYKMVALGTLRRRV